MTTKTCSACKQEKTLTEFGVRRASKDGRSPVCKPCNNEKSKDWRSKNPGGNTESVKQWKLRNPDKVKGYAAKRRQDRPEVAAVVWRKHRYGIIESQYQAMLIAQGNSCAICKMPFNHTGPRFEKPQVDHCHASGKVRGLLCTECNQGLGRFKDNAEALTAAIEYLRRSS